MDSATTGDDEARAVKLTERLADAPKADDHSAVRDYLAALTGLGCAPLLVYPASKKPAEVRPPRQRRADDQAASDAARAAGHPHWQKVKAEAGVHLATPDTATLGRYLDYYVKTFGDAVAVNVAVSLGRSRLVVVDCDTTEQMAAFLADAEADPDTAPTVRSPGQLGADGVTLVHRDGGHFYFVVPEGVELPEQTEAMTLGEGDGAYSVLWGAGKYVLTPPSVRPEGPYTASGPVWALPEWLADRITAYGQARYERARDTQTRSDTHSDPVARWGLTVPWAAILEPAGWTPTGKADGCGCPTWTAPGPHGSQKSATAHEPGCGEWTAAADPPLHVWTDNPGPPWAGYTAATGKTTFSKLQAVALLHYDDNTGAAMDALGIELTDAHALAVDDLPADFGSPRAAALGIAVSAPGEDATARKIRERASQLWIDREARKLLADNDAAEFTLPPVASLDALLATPDDPVTMRIERVWPSGGAKVLCAAPAGAGKTTLNGNLVRALADGDPFLGAFEVLQRAERIVIIDNEMTAGMLKRWLRRQGVRNTAAVVDVVTLRGQAGLFNLGNDRLRELWTRRLADLGCDFVIFDCLSPVINAMGLKEATELGKFLHPMTDMLTAAGVPDVLVHHHMGHEAERARGDSTALGWSDANWKIVRNRENGKDERYFATDKVRDAELVAEGLLSFDPATGRLTYIGGDRAETGKNDTLERRITAILEVLAEHHATHPDDVKGLNATALRRLVGGKNEITDAALKRASAKGRGQVLVTFEGRAKWYRIAPEALDPLHVGGDETAPWTAP